MSRIVVAGENSQQAREALGFAKILSDVSGSTISFLVFSGTSDEIASAAGGIASEAYNLNGAGHPPESLAAALDILSKDGIYAVVAPALKNLTDALARFSAKARIPMLTEVIEAHVMDDELLLKRGVMAGRAIGEYHVKPPFTATVPMKKFEPPEASGALEVEDLEVSAEAPKLIGVEKKVKGEVDIEGAEIVIGVGRGFKKEEDLKTAFQLAELLGGEVGCSRPIAADYGWLPEDRWIGISSKKIRPKLYFAIGISGAPQHMSGVLDSKIIAAVNKDKNAPIFQYADYGIVGDLYQFLPALLKKLEEKQ